MKAKWIWVSILAVATVWVPGVSYSQDRESGQYWYLNYCASCHGRAGKGDGSVAKVLNKTPADLTKLSDANGGTFPSERVVETIIGRREVEAHGTKEIPVWGMPLWGGAREMPVWGRAVRYAPGIVRARVRAIVNYISTLQGK